MSDPTGRVYNVLRLENLERLALQKRLDEIGKTSGDGSADQAA